MTLIYAPEANASLVILKNFYATQLNDKLHNNSVKIIEMALAVGLNEVDVPPRCCLSLTSQR